jgi:predicted ATPase
MPFINEVDTEVKGRPGWIEIKVAENFPAEEKTVTISPAHISDGTLRMLAISALQETDRTSGMVLLDEIENGINPHIADKMVYDLIERRGMQRQIIVTTHSSVMLDYFPPESIIFIWRNGDGVVYNQALFSDPEMYAQLKYMYPGEAWINMDEKDIIAKLLGEKRDG